MKDLIPIGRFADESRLTVKALRYYDSLGLLKPAVVDPDSGYRYYSPTQLELAARIRLLRIVDMPLVEIRELLEERDLRRMRARLDLHRARIEERIAAQHESLSTLDRLRESLRDGSSQVESNPAAG